MTIDNPDNGADSFADAAGGAVPRSATEALESKQVPPPPKRSRHARNTIVMAFNAIISLMVFAAVVAGGAAYFGQLRFIEAGPLKTASTIVIREGASLPRIADQLEANGIIDSAFVFRLGVRAHRAAASMKAGEYAFDPGMSMYDVMETIRTGRGVLHKVTFPEGLTSHQILQRLADNDLLVGDLPDTVPPEGSLLPETYPFQRGTTRQQIIDRMRHARDKVVQKIWDNRAPGLPLKSIDEFVTLASIVEKETGRADERPRVAAVFINRLKKGMKLQSDPTILYGLFGGQGRPADRSILKSDIAKPTPYNTYVIDGLPPGPIANPGRAALEAVANPAQTDELFFVADGTGGHVFSNTLKEHQQNVKRWREIEKKLKEMAKENAQSGDSADTAPKDHQDAATSSTGQ